MPSGGAFVLPIQFREDGLLADLLTCGKLNRCAGRKVRPCKSGDPCSMEFRSRRSPVMGTRGIVASSQPLASSAGARVLMEGGNAADAAVAAAAALAVTEPCSTGIGGDAFALYFDAKSGKVTAVLGNGASPKHATVPAVIDPLGPSAVTVPGAAAAWADITEKFGRKTLAENLAPAVQLAEDGFPVGYVTAEQWQASEPLLRKQRATALLVDGQRAPRPGQLFKNPDLARVIRDLGEQGKQAFYDGRVAAAIVEALETRGGCMCLDDLRQHETRIADPIAVAYRDVTVFEVPPPTHGIAALMALNIADNFDLKAIAGNVHSSGPYLHTMIESMRLAYADARAHVADPDVQSVPMKELLDRKYGTERSKLIGEKALDDAPAGDISAFSNPDTVQFCAVDAEGNACSMINSNFLGFGTAIVPDGCGFTLHNRGLNFNLEPSHPNCYGPQKKPYHTIIPALATRRADGTLFGAFGVMGGFMQPQGHFQVLCNIIDWQMDPQSALDAPRFCVGDPSTGKGKEVYIEDGVDGTALKFLSRAGHKVVGPVVGSDRQLFGRGQVILYDADSRVATAGSDPRADGTAVAV